MRRNRKHVSTIVPILLALSLLLNVVLIIMVMTPKESKTFLDGRYATDFSKGYGDRDYYFDITFYENGTAYVEQHYMYSNVTYETTCSYSYSSESNIAVISFVKNNYQHTYSFEVNDNQTELVDFGFTLVRNFERDAENMSLMPTEPTIVIATHPTEPEVVEEVGKIYITEETDELGFFDPTTVVKIPCEDGYFSFDLPTNASNIQLNDNQISFSILTNWMQINYTYEVVTKITSAPEAELKIKSITDTLPYSLPSGYSALYVLQDLEEDFYPSQFDYFTDTKNIYDVWYDDITSNGAAYFYESCNYTTPDDLVFSKMITESYNYGGGITVHETVEVVHFNFIDYYNSFETRIEKENADKEFSATLKGYMIEVTLHQKGSYSSCASGMRGIDWCLWKKIKVLPS